MSADVRRMKTADLITMFIAYQLARGLSAATIRRRRGTLATFAHHLEPLPLTAATPELVDDYLGGLHTQATRRAYRADLFAFYRWAARRAICPVNPVDDTEPVRVPRSLPRPIDARTVPVVIAAAQAHSERLALMVGLAVYAGLRRAEIAAVDTVDIHRDASPPVIVVRNGKGGKDRVVPLHPALAVLLPERLPAGRLVPLSAGHVGKAVADHLRACGIDATCHQLRHTFGTEAARVSHGDLLAVASLLGHGSMNTTMCYTALVGRDTAATVAAMYAA